MQGYVAAKDGGHDYPPEVASRATFAANGGADRVLQYYGLAPGASWQLLLLVVIK